MRPPRQICIRFRGFCRGIAARRREGALAYRTCMASCKILSLGLGLALLMAVTASANAADPVPRFASLASDKVYMREGPTYRHPILWVYRRKGLPVEVIGQYDVWRRVRDVDGTTGWIHGSMIAETRTVL